MTIAEVSIRIADLEAFKPLAAALQRFAESVRAADAAGYPVEPRERDLMDAITAFMGEGQTEPRT